MQIQKKCLKPDGYLGIRVTPFYHASSKVKSDFYMQITSSVEKNEHLGNTVQHATNYIETRLKKLLLEIKTLVFS